MGKTPAVDEHQRSNAFVHLSNGAGQWNLHGFTVPRRPRPPAVLRPSSRRRSAAAALRPPRRTGRPDRPPPRRDARRTRRGRASRLQRRPRRQVGVGGGQERVRDDVREGQQHEPRGAAAPPPEGGHLRDLRVHKILGTGSAERHWKLVEEVKSGQRINTDPVKIDKH